LTESRRYALDQSHPEKMHLASERFPMNEQNLIPVSDEQAKFGREVVAAGRQIGGWIGDTLGDLPKDLVGWLVGTRVKAQREEESDRLLGRR
jgi:hypothetical protein